jgi:BirA family biotin operon repressor/biotin-[acetyl-CoA-carboxylase] ligase
VLVVLSTVGSTNDMAREWVEALRSRDLEPPPCALFALEQSAGRGRFARTWSSPGEKGVYATVIRPLWPRMALLDSALALPRGLAAALEAFSGLEIGLKWPNDLRVGERKVGGVLIETVSSSSPEVCTLLMGFGINVRHDQGDLPVATATSLRLEGSTAGSLGALSASLVSGLEAELERARRDREGLLSRYRRKLVHQVGDRLRVRVGDEEYVEGSFEGISEQGLLRLREPGGRIHLLAAGEIDG